MSPLAPTKILLGISLNPTESLELLSWAIEVLANPNDTIVALHVLVEQRKWRDVSSSRYQTQYRQAKASVISIMGEFARICQPKHIFLEARVGLSPSVDAGLIEEAKCMNADFLIIGRRSRHNRSSTNRLNCEITRNCFDRAPERCSVISLRRRYNGRECNSMNIKRNGFSPRTVLNVFEEESQSNSSVSGESTIMTKVSPAAPVCKYSNKSTTTPLKFIFSILRSPFYASLSRRKRNQSFCSINSQELNQPSSSSLRCFTYQDIAFATNHFHPDNLVGKGGYAEVYRGDLEDGRTIAIKKLSERNVKDQNKEKEFLTELGILGHVNHPNTAILVGCCIENGLHLIFNFIPNGTLSSALHGKKEKPLEWAVRYKIILGIARGLHYLHKCCQHRIIHRDIKASNVLLGPDYEPQISDFGLAKWLPNKWTHHAVIPIEGTFGYLAPEYFMHGIVDEKTDVFAFGVLLLEIVTGRRPVDSSKQSLLLWAKPLMESGKIDELVDPCLEGRYDAVEVQRVILTSSYCIRQSSNWRPSMSEVQELLRNGEGCEVARSWRMPKFSDEEMDDYSMVFGYDLPTSINLDDIL